MVARARRFGPTCGVLVAWIILSSQFGTRQEIWLDETTQMSGLTLGPFEVVNWLAGEAGGRFGVPGDRMPPLSYWVGWLWASALGLSETALRCLGILAVGVAIVLTMATARRMWGERAALASGLALALSPNVVVEGVEIRAYPLLLLFSACAFHYLAKLNNEGAGPRRSAWIGLALSCIAAGYTHFYGVVLSGALILAALDRTRFRTGSRLGLAVTTGAIALSWVGLIPFVRSSVTLSNHGAEAPNLARSVVRLVYRVMGGNPSVSVYAPVALGVLAGAIAAMGAAYFLHRGLLRSLTVAVISGGTAAVAAQLDSAPFEALSVSYNLWMLPAVALVIGAGASGVGRISRWIGCTGVGLYLAGSVAGSIVLIGNASTFAHCPSERIEVRLRDERARGIRLIVVHDASGAWGHVYFPLYYQFGPAVEHYLIQHELGKVTLHRLPRLEISISPADIDADRVLLVSAQLRGADALSDFVRTKRVPKLNVHVADAFTASGWKISSRETFMGMIATELTWMSRR